MSQKAEAGLESRGCSGPLSPIICSPSFPTSPGKKTTERNLEVNGFLILSGLHKPFVVLPVAPVIPQAPRHPRHVGVGAGNRLRKAPSPEEVGELGASGSASASSHRIRTVYVN